MTIRFNPNGGVFHCYEVISHDGKVLDSFGTYRRAEQALAALKYAAQTIKG